MHYNWAGDVIYRDTLLPGKRFVIGSPEHAVDTDIREWVQPSNSRVLFEAVAHVPCLPRTKNLGDFDRRAQAIWAWVAAHVRYEYDPTRAGYADFWLFPEETLSLAVGDCEDSSILLYALLLAAGISPYCLRVALGHLWVDGRLIGSHAWVVYHDEGGVWRLLESTLDAVPPALPAADGFTRPDSPHHYRPDFCFNGEHLWWIAPPDFPGIAPPPRLDDYLRYREQQGIRNVEMTCELRQRICEHGCRL